MPAYVLFLLRSGIESETYLLISFIVSSMLSYDVPSGAMTARPTIERSSSGASSEGNAGANNHAIPKDRINKTNPIHRNLKKKCSDLSYPLLIASNQGSVFRYNHPCDAFAFSK